MTATSTFLQDQAHTCGACGSTLTGRWEKITPGLCRALIKFYTGICAKQKNELHLQKECDLTKSEYTNFQKLRYFALAVKFKDKPGSWLITSRGRDFIRNYERIPKKVFIFQNKIQERSEERVSIADVLKVKPYWLERDDFLKAPLVSEMKQVQLF